MCLMSTWCTISKSSVSISTKDTHHAELEDMPELTLSILL